MKDCISPPIERNCPVLRELENEENDDQGHDSTRVEGGGRDKVELRPPTEIVLAYEVLEDKRDGEPGGIHKATNWWHKCRAVEQNRDGNIFDPRLGKLARQEPEWKWKETPDQKRPIQGCVEIAITK